MMTKLPQKDKSKINIMSDAVHYKPKPGTLMFFPSYLPHEFVVDDGIHYLFGSRRIVLALNVLQMD